MIEHTRKKITALMYEQAQLLILLEKEAHQAKARAEEAQKVADEYHKISLQKENKKSYEYDSFMDLLSMSHVNITTNDTSFAVCRKLNFSPEEGKDRFGSSVVLTIQSMLYKKPRENVPDIQ